jgi:hypothetical protein
LKLFANALYFGLSLQLGAYLIWAFQVFGPLLNYPISTQALDLSNPGNWFELNLFNSLVGIGGAAAITIVGILTRTGTYALYAVLIWALGNFVPFVQQFFLALPNTIIALVSSTGASSDITNPLLTVVSIIFAFGAFMYIFGLVFQREML